VDKKPSCQHGVYLIALSLVRGLFEHLQTDFAATRFFSIRYGGVAALNWKLMCFEIVLNPQNFLALYKLICCRPATSFITSGQQAPKPETDELRKRN
jgi:hypothetical protein